MDLWSATEQGINIVIYFTRIRYGYSVKTQLPERNHETSQLMNPHGRIRQQTDYSLSWYILQIYNTRYLDASQAGHKLLMPLLCEYSKLPSADWQHHFCNYT